ncbi:PD40 domain-containing protein, partial [Candidatus Woesearchaeota archaeon]|nr:PD40 domain-containing protein [Candidatus Woesearchaeota archaeon]
MKNQEFEKAGLAINEILEFIENTTQAPDQKQLQSNTSVSSTKTPNGKIAFVTNRDGNDEIYIMNSDGTGATRLTDNPASDNDPNWSPDGTKIGFRSERGGGSGIYVMNADGSNVNRLSPVPGFDSQPTWSPDGTKIAFSSTRDGQPEIYVMNADGTNAKRLT